MMATILLWQMKMAASRSYRELNALELLDWFQALHPDAFISKGRDSHLLSRFLKDSGVAPTLVLEGMVYGYGCRSIPIFLNSSDDWLMDDALQQEAELVVFLSKDQIPPACYMTYRDLKDTGVESAEMEATWQEAKQQLEQIVNDATTATATVRDRSRIAQRYRLQHGAVRFGE